MLVSGSELGIATLGLEACVAVSSMMAAAVVVAGGEGDVDMLASATGDVSRGASMRRTSLPTVGS